MADIIAIVLASLFFLVGLLGTLVPILPGAPLIWLGMLLYGLVAGFEGLGLFFFVTQALLAIAVMGVDYLFSAMGSHYFGGSRAAFFGAAAGLLVGLFFFPVGLLVGPFIGAALADLLFRRRADQAIISGFGASIGFWIALPIKLFLEALMLTWFIWRIL